MIRKKLTESQFQGIKPGLRLLESQGVTTNVKHGQINLLISGTVDPCTGLTSEDSEYRIVGATVNFTTYTRDGKVVNNRDALKQCDQFSVILPNLETNQSDYYLIDVVGRKVYVDYIYFRCNTPISSSNISYKDKTVIEVELSEDGWGIVECVQDSESDTTESKGKWVYDYKAILPYFTDIQYFPYYSSDFFKDDYNPLINNASASRLNSSTVGLGLLSASRGFFDRSIVGKAEIPDYWYASLGIGLGRYLGTKCTRNLVCEPYVGFKKTFTDNYLTASKTNNYVERVTSSGSVETKNIHKSVDRSFYTVQSFSGSVFSSGSVAEVTSSIRASNSSLEELKFAADSRYAEIDTGLLLSGSGEKIFKAWESVGVLGSIPKVGDVLYRFNENEGVRYRLTDCMVYVPEAGQLLCTDNYGVVSKYYTVD